MANLILAVHNAFLDGYALQNIHQALMEDGRTKAVLFNEIYDHCRRKPLDEIRHCIERNNHERTDDLTDYSLHDLIQEFALMLDVEDVARFANSSDHICDLGRFQNYQFIYFADLADNRKLAFTEVDNETDVTETTMKEIYEMLVAARSDDNPFAMFDDCRCEVI